MLKFDEQTGSGAVMLVWSFSIMYFNRISGLRSLSTNHTACISTRAFHASHTTLNIPNHSFMKFHEECTNHVVLYTKSLSHRCVATD